MKAARFAFYVALTAFLVAMTFLGVQRFLERLAG